MTQTSAIAILLLVAGQAEPSNPSNENVICAELSAEDRLAFMKQEAAEYKLFLDPSNGKELALTEPVLRFNDNITGVVDAVVVFWVDDGQPEAVASFWYRKDGLRAHEFQSLSRTRVLAELRDQTVWRPLRPGVEANAVDEEAAPATTALARLSQMRKMVRRFSAAVIVRSGRRQLRLLPQPIYRYGDQNQEVLDAAWFAFAKGTNPEVMVLIEARRGEDDSYGWNYSPVRMSSAACEMKRDDIVVWTAPYTRRQLPSETYFNIYSR